MAFMEIFTDHCQWYIVDVRGSTDYIPCHIVGSLELPGGMAFDEGETITRDFVETWLLEKADPPCSEEMASTIADEIWDTIAHQFHNYVGEGIGPIRKPDDLQEVSLKTMWGARYSAPGYLDCTDWVLGETEEEAVAECKELYGNDDDETEDEETNDENDCHQWESISETDDGFLVCATTIGIPSDLDECEQRLGEHAIDNVRERAPDYCIPAEWTAEKIGENALDTIFKVTRTSRIVRPKIDGLNQ